MLGLLTLSFLLAGCIQARQTPQSSSGGVSTPVKVEQIWCLRLLLKTSHLPSVPVILDW